MSVGLVDLEIGILKDRETVITMKCNRCGKEVGNKKCRKVTTCDSCDKGKKWRFRCRECGRIYGVDIDEPEKKKQGLKHRIRTFFFLMFAYMALAIIIPFALVIKYLDDDDDWDDKEND